MRCYAAWPSGPVLSRQFLNPTAKTGGEIFALFVIAENAAKT